MFAYRKKAYLGGLFLLLFVGYVKVLKFYYSFFFFIIRIIMTSSVLDMYLVILLFRLPKHCKHLRQKIQQNIFLVPH